MTNYKCTVLERVRGLPDRRLLPKTIAGYRHLLLPKTIAGYRRNKGDLRQIKRIPDQLQRDQLQRDQQYNDRLPKTITGYLHRRQKLNRINLQPDQLLLKEEGNQTSHPNHVNTARHKISHEYQTGQHRKQQGKYRELKAIILTRSNSNKNKGKGNNDNDSKNDNIVPHSIQGQFCVHRYILFLCTRILLRILQN